MTVEMNWLTLTGTIKPGDKIGCSGWRQEAFFIVDEDGNVVFDRKLQADQFLRNDWLIIKPAPKVLTAKEFLSNEYGTKTGRSVFNSEEAINTFDNGHQNGRLERDLELKPVFEAIKNLEDDNPPSYFKAVKIITATNNLPPLNKNE